MTTRQHILDILSERGEATIDEISDELMARSGKRVSSVTIRYHLNILMDEGEVTEPRTVPRLTRGRPQHIFTAAQKHEGRGNSAEVLSFLLAAMKDEQPELAERLVSRVVASMAEQAAVSQQLSQSERLSRSVDFLNARGYNAAYERVERGYVLYTRNCPYHTVENRSALLCGLDMRLVEAVVGQPVQRLMRLSDGDSSCAYFIEESH